jgi:maltooligosyltrehalose trehalohydrolase
MSEIQIDTRDGTHALPPPHIQHFGPILKERQIRFQLWAPDAEAVDVVLDNQRPNPMERSKGGFWFATAAGGAGTRYRFVVDGLTIPDPASRFQPDDVHGPSEVVDEHAYQWKHTAWNGLPWERTVIYEAHVGILGGFNGLRSRLAAIADLRVTAIELMPLADFSGSRNWGYDGVLPFAPDSAYGTPDELRALIDEAHGLGLMVFLDVVYNHFGPDGNFLPAYAPSFFDEATPTPWGPAIEFAEPCVRRFFTENALYWLEQFRIDGLRLDAVHAIKNRDWLLELAAEIRLRLKARHVHLVLENENNDAALLGAGFDAQWNDDFHNVMHVLLTGETHAYYKDFAHRPIDRLARSLSQGFIYQGEPSPNRNGEPRGQPSGHLPPSSFVNFLQNHDQTGNRALGERLAAMTPKPALQAAMALLLLCPHIPLLFMGEEAGATEPFLFFTDFHGELGKAVREGRRREFANAPGFSAEHDAAAIPDPNAVLTFEASRFSDQGLEAPEWRNLVKLLIGLRHRHIVPHLSGTTAAGVRVVGPKALIAYWRLANESVLTLACNLDALDVTCSLPNGKPFFGAAPIQGELPLYSTLAWITS